jgi:phosphoribosylglycinamide formyltransferase 1
LVLEPSSFTSLNPWDAALAEELAQHDIDVMLLSGYLRKVGPRTRSVFAGRIFNTHPGLLPAYGGVGMCGDAVHRAVLADRASESGATIHIVDAEYDTGPVVAQRRLSVLPHDTVETLKTRVQTAERALVIDTLAGIAQGDLSP